MKNLTTIIVSAAVALCVVSSATAGVGVLLKPFIKSEVKHVVATQTGKSVAKAAVKRGATRSASSALQKSLKAVARPKNIMALGVAGATLTAAANVSSQDGVGEVGPVLKYGFSALLIVPLFVAGLYAVGLLRRAIRFAACKIPEGK